MDPKVQKELGTVLEGDGEFETTEEEGGAGAVRKPGRCRCLWWALPAGTGSGHVSACTGQGSRGRVRRGAKR